MTREDRALTKVADERERRRDLRRSNSKAAHSLVQFSENLGPGNHVPCEVLGQEKENGRLVVQVVGCEPYEVKAPLAGKEIVPSKEGPRWQWRPGTVHQIDDCEECRARRGR